MLPRAVWQRRAAVFRSAGPHEAFQENVSRAGPAAAASYTLVGALLLLGGLGYAARLLAGHVALVSPGGSAARDGGWILRTGENDLASMTPLWWMIGGSIGAWLIVTVAAPVPVNPELLWGMFGPLVSAVATWIVVARAQRLSPERVIGTLVMLLRGEVGVLRRVHDNDVAGRRAAARAVRRRVHYLLHRAVRDGSAVPEALVCRRDALFVERVIRSRVRCRNRTPSKPRPRPPKKADIGKTIVEHVSNSPLDHPLIHLPTVFGIDLSVTKHVLMLWIVADRSFCWW